MSMGAILFSEMEKKLPDSAEKIHAMTRLSEAIMWVRMAEEIDCAPPPKVELGIAPTSKYPNARPGHTLE